MATGTARTLDVGLSADLIIAAIKRMKRREREEFIEDLLASTSPDYLDSIREARSDRRAGRTKSLAEGGTGCPRSAGSSVW